MNRSFRIGNGRVLVIVLTLLLLVTGMVVDKFTASPDENTPTQAYIIQGSDLATAAQAVQAAGGTVTHELDLIHTG